VQGDGYVARDISSIGQQWKAAFAKEALLGKLAVTQAYLLKSDLDESPKEMTRPD